MAANYASLNLEPLYTIPPTEDLNFATFCPILEIGGSYDYALSYKEKSESGTIKNKDLVNSGFSGIVGIGFNIPSTHWYWSARYSHQFYKYYNKDAEINGEKLNFNEKSTFGTFMLVSSYAF